jgi:glycosyltransferase involved in cell wall biosynthesis
MVVVGAVPRRRLDGDREPRQVVENGMSTRRKRILVITGPPKILGGVATKARILTDFLMGRGHHVTVAHYTTFSTDSDLNGSIANVLHGHGPRLRRYVDWGGVDFVAVGCWLPELEATYFRDSRRWRGLVAAHDRHIAVGGTPLPAAPLAAAAIPHLIWCAADVEADRSDRQTAMMPLRRWYDRLVVEPLLHRLERRVLAGSGRVLGVSDYTVACIRRAASDFSRPVTTLIIPVDLERFRPPFTPAPSGVIGFAGRLSDPRKNIGLLLDAVALMRTRGMDVRLELAGNTPANFAAVLTRRALDGRVRCRGHLSGDDLPGFYRGLDVFAIPSRQEGHAIVGIEAAASGVPIVSTRCGGPESYVRDGVTGFLTASNADAMADALSRIVANRTLRDAMSRECRALAEREYGIDAFTHTLAVEWRQAWPNDSEGP